MKHAREDYNRIQDPAGLIPQDEPVFLIRGQDRCGPEALRNYARLAALAGAETGVIRLTLDHARLMEQWQAEHRQKTPDLTKTA
jgi:hypothetical protein